MRYDVVIVGGGPAGLSAASAARQEGANKVLIIEREKYMGGILNQCIHIGFGQKDYAEELTGPEYAQKLIGQLDGVEVFSETTVLSVDKSLKVTAVSVEKGLIEIQAGAIVLAMGCREKPRGALDIAGTRPSGIFTAGTVQRLVKTYGKMCGKEIVIMGSFDLGLIMARRLTYEGAKIKMVIESMPYYMGLSRNVAECLYDNDIPLLLNTKVIEIIGKERLEAIKIADVQSDGSIKEDTIRTVKCDTLILSAGLIPENELSQNAGIEISPHSYGAVVDQYCRTSVEGIFACGNVLHTHDIADLVADESALAGREAAKYALYGNVPTEKAYRLIPQGNTKYTMPQLIRETDQEITINVRLRQARKKAYINVICNGEIIQRLQKPIMIHGEMEQIKIDGKKIKGDLIIDGGGDNV